jgi:hypothetical protein
MRRAYKPPAPTLAQLRAHTCWVWLTCENVDCLHETPVALAPFMIRWGVDASSEVLRRSARCSLCKTKGASTQVPSWGGRRVGPQPFAVDRAIGELHRRSEAADDGL